MVLKACLLLGEILVFSLCEKAVEAGSDAGWEGNGVVPSGIISGSTPLFLDPGTLVRRSITIY